MNTDEIKNAIEFRQMTRPIKAGGLRAMVRQGRWADIGRMFDFTPAYTEIGGSLYFDWTSCNPAFWASYQPQKYARGKEIPKVTVFRSKRLATKVHPTQQMQTYQHQGGVCYYCKKATPYENWSIDHKIPRCRGGSNGASNKVGACKTCNNSKACLTEQEFVTAKPTARKALVKATFIRLRGGKMII